MLELYIAVGINRYVWLLCGYSLKGLRIFLIIFCMVLRLLFRSKLSFKEIVLYVCMYVYTCVLVSKRSRDSLV